MRPIRAILEFAGALTRGALSVVRSDPIATAAGLDEFIARRAAYASQTALHGYLKTRMGTQFRRYFEDDEFSATIRIAQWQVCTACLSDLVIYAVARVDEIGDKAVFAQARYRAAFALAKQSADVSDPADRMAEFAVRSGAIDWTAEIANSAPFVQSAVALVAAVPVSEAFRKSDAPILENSIRLRLSNAAEDLRGRLDVAAIAAEFRAGL